MTRRLILVVALIAISIAAGGCAQSAAKVSASVRPTEGDRIACALFDAEFVQPEMPNFYEPEVPNYYKTVGWSNGGNAAIRAAGAAMGKVESNTHGFPSLKQLSASEWQFAEACQALGIGPGDK